MFKAAIFDMYETLITHYRTPLYFSAEMAEDAGISAADFQRIWRATDRERSVGQLTFEETIKRILRENNCYSNETLDRIILKRIATKRALFGQLHDDIIPMLKALKSSGIKLGIISNCFSEEAAVIRESELVPYFDSICLSYEMGCMKPDTAIFGLCVAELSVTPQECLYVGDGGSRELETAKSLGMTAVQAMWYQHEDYMQISRRDSFPQAESPFDIPYFCTKAR